MSTHLLTREQVDAASIAAQRKAEAERDAATEAINAVIDTVLADALPLMRDELLETAQKPLCPIFSSIVIIIPSSLQRFVLSKHVDRARDAAERAFEGANAITARMEEYTNNISLKVSYMRASA
jgi:hypothetical protein